jgi:predicted nucleic acid-binding protein
MADAATPLVDTNLFLRHVLDDEATQSPRAHRLFADLERGVLTCWTTSTVIFECVYTLQSRYHVPRFETRSALLPLLSIANLQLDGRERYRDIFDLYVTQRGLSFADCYHAVLARDLAGGEIVSFDRGFDRIPGLTRIEPPLPA